MTQSDILALSRLNFRTTHLPNAEAFAFWRKVMAPLFRIEQARYSSVLPSGDKIVLVVGEIGS